MDTTTAVTPRAELRTERRYRKYATAVYNRKSDIRC
jgi:hypothetical protein